MAQFDLEKEFSGYYEKGVRLPKAERDEMRSRRNINRDRLILGLKNNEEPSVVKHLIQGSYAMHTMVQRPNKDYDIDDGAVFDQDALKGSNGADKTALDARKMVCKALRDNRFTKEPEVRSKCVRVHYNEGYHIDVPVYRRYEDAFGTEHFELAGPEWKESDPTKITDWFKDACKEEYGKPGPQLRRMVCLLKMWASSRSSWRLPSGLVFSVLAKNAYDKDDVFGYERDDEAFVAILKSMKDWLDFGYRYVKNPVDHNENLAEGKERESQLNRLKDALEVWLPALDVLSAEDCTKNQALEAVGKFFNTDFFEQYYEDEDNADRNSSNSMRQGAEGAGIGVGSSWSWLAADDAESSPKKPVKKGGKESFG